MNGNKLKISKKINAILSILLIICLIIISVLLLIIVKNKESIRPLDSDSSLFEIVTEYCTIEYPNEWEDYLVYSEEKNDEEYTYQFNCELNGNTYELFEIYFNSPDKGQLLGYISDGDSKASISAKLSSFDPDDSWSEEDKNLYYSMKEGLNEIIKSIEENDKYVK